MRVLIALLGCACATTLFGVTTSSWTHTAESDFTGESEAVVVSPLGELRLARHTQPLVESAAGLEVIYQTCSLPDGSVIVASGPDGTISRIVDGQRQVLHHAANGGIATAVAPDERGRVLTAFSGDPARLLRINPDTGDADELYRSDTTQFIWAIHPLPDGSILLATGPDGSLLQRLPDGTIKTVLQTRQNNILSLLPLTEDQVIIGTDPDGLVIRVNILSGDWFVLHDADEPEITALARDAAGNLYAAGSSVAETSRPAGAPGVAPGRRELGPEVPLRREPPTAPEPPQLPDPAPGEPEPIPKANPAPRPAADAPDDVKSDAEDAAAEVEQPAGGSPATLLGSGDAAESSAVYRISPAGFVSEVFRRPVTIHSMLLVDDALIIGTGPDGIVYETRPGSEEVAQLVRTGARQVSALTRADANTVVLGLSNPGALLTMSAGHAARGMYTSEVLDARQVAQFGKLQLQGTLPADTAVSLATRSGNVRDPKTGGWSAWSDDAAAAEFMDIAAPAARFLQYRLTFASRDPAHTPTVEQVKLNYLLPNMPPRITAVNLEAEAADSADSSPGVHQIRWEAADPNDDRLVYSVHFRMGHRGNWILLKDKLQESEFRWNTRQLSDGRYQIRVTASDQPSNPPGQHLTATRYSESLLVDNTAPVIGDVKTELTGTTAQVTLRVVDRTSTVAEVYYALNSSDDWQAATSSDMLYDSPDETVRFALQDLAVGTHQVAIRARDSQGNTAYETLLVTVRPEEIGR